MNVGGRVRGSGQPRRRRSVGRGLFAWTLAAVVGAAAGCFIEIDQRLSCGDAYVSAAEECDPRDPSSFVDACRDAGFMADATCDPLTCTILASDTDCNTCGDGVALGSEECDGSDLKGKGCPSGVGNLQCTDQCNLDYSDCPQTCGDGILSGDEECDFARDCETSEDCAAGQVCYAELGECVDANGGFLPLIACTDYSSSYAGLGKPYVQGVIGDCNLDCVYSRSDCSFCGDGQLDPEYEDVALPNGTATIPAEVCDGSDAQPDEIAAYCRPLCLEPPFDPDAEIACDFDCQADCQGIELPDDITPGEIDPAELNCCLGPGSACVGDGVPDLPCCATPDKIKPEGCAWSATPPIALVCPGF